MVTPDDPVRTGCQAGSAPYWNDVRDGHFRGERSAVVRETVRRRFPLLFR